MIKYDCQVYRMILLIGGYSMDLKKCVRCGCFFSSDNNVCYNCESKDRQDISKLNTYIGNSSEIGDINNLSFNTGVSTKNITRFIENNDIANF